MPRPAPDRHRLPNRRSSETHALSVGNHSFTATIGLDPYEDSKPMPELATRLRIMRAELVETMAGALAGDGDWRPRLERRLRGGELSDFPSFESHLAKYRSLMPSLALIFHLVDVVSGRVTGPVSLEAAIFAADWCGYLEAHARKIYSPELRPDVTAAHRLADKIKVGDIQDGQTVREIYRREWPGLTNAEKVYAGLEVLTRHQWVRIEQQETGGRPSEVLLIHPKIRRAA